MLHFAPLTHTEGRRPFPRASPPSPCSSRDRPFLFVLLIIISRPGKAYVGLLIILDSTLDCPRGWHSDAHHVIHSSPAQNVHQSTGLTGKGYCSTDSRVGVNSGSVVTEDAADNFSGNFEPAPCPQICVNVSLLSSGYMGTYCEVDIDDCESNPCVNDGICRDVVNGFTCTCQPGKMIE